MFTQPTVNQITSAYQGNPAPLAQKVDRDKKQHGGIPQDLRQLLALNDITQGRENMGIQQALQTPTNMPTVAQDLQERARQALQARMMQQAQEQMRKDGRPNMVPMGTPRPPMQPQGLDALQTNVGEGYADGGIIGNVKHFTTGDQVVDPMGAVIQGTSMSEDDRTLLERLGVFNPANRRANEKLERELKQREAAGLNKGDIDRGRLPDPRALPNMPDIKTQVAQAAADAAKEEKAPVKTQTRVNAPEAPGIVSALPPAQTEAYKKLTEMMNQDPEAKAKALRDRYMKEVGTRDLSIFDKTAAELEARKQKLNAPKAGYDAMMEYLENIAMSGGRTSAEAGSRGAVRQRQQQMAREAEQNTLMDKILELGAKKSEAEFAEKKGMFDLTQRERDEIFKKAFDAAKSVNSSDDEAKRIAAQAVENEKNRQNQIRSAQIGAQDRDNLMSRAKALMAADPTKKMTLDQALQRAAEIGAVGQIESAEVRRQKNIETGINDIDKKYPLLEALSLNPKNPKYIEMKAARDKEVRDYMARQGMSGGINTLPGAASSGTVPLPPGFKRD